MILLLGDEVAACPEGNDGEYQRDKPRHKCRIVNAIWVSRTHSVTDGAPQVARHVGAGGRPEQKKRAKEDLKKSHRSLRLGDYKLTRGAA